MSRRPEGAQVPVPGPFVLLLGSSLLLVAPVCSPCFGPLRLSCSPGGLVGSGFGRQGWASGEGVGPPGPARRWCVVVSRRAVSSSDICP
jgi:hypothetical protein